MNPIRTFVFAVLVALAGPVATASGSASGALDPLACDADRLAVQFKVSVFGLFPVTGVFERLTGVPPEELVAQVDGRALFIEVGSVNTRNDVRDDFLRKIFFNVKRYPYITFTVSRVVFDDQGPRRIIGEISLRGTTQPVVFEVLPLDQPTVSSNGATLVWRATTTIQRSAFGLTGLSALVSDEVDIMVDIAGFDA